MTAGQTPGENGKNKISTGDSRCVTIMNSRAHHRSNSYTGRRLGTAGKADYRL